MRKSSKKLSDSLRATAVPAQLGCTPKYLPRSSATILRPLVCCSFMVSVIPLAKIFKMVIERLLRVDTTQHNRISKIPREEAH